MKIMRMLLKFSFFNNYIVTFVKTVNCFHALRPLEEQLFTIM